jgi:hypothetical protein
MAWCFVYSMTSLRNGKVYVGVTSDPGARFIQHASLIDRNEHSCTAVQEHFADHKASDVEFAVLEAVDLPVRNAKSHSANDVEHRWMVAMNAVNHPRDVMLTRFVDVDWSKGDGVLGRLYGVSRQRIHQLRLQAGYARVRKPGSGRHPVISWDEARRRLAAANWSVGDSLVARACGVTNYQVRRLRPEMTTIAAPDGRRRIMVAA